MNATGCLFIYFLKSGRKLNKFEDTLSTWFPLLKWRCGPYDPPVPF